MIWHESGGTESHTHEIVDFEFEDDEAIIRSNTNMSIVGESSIGTNGVITWEDVDTQVDLNGGVLVMAVNDEQTDQHFAAQPAYGIVNSIEPCSDTPGPNMQILPPCDLGTDDTVS